MVKLQSGSVPGLNTIFTIFTVFTYLLLLLFYCFYCIYCSCCFTVFTVFTALAVLLLLLYLLLLLFLLFLLFFPENRLRSALCFRAGFTQNPLPLCAGTGLFSWHPHRICGACTTNIPTFSVDFKSELQYLVKNFQRFSILFLDSFSCLF